jgi:hypothetical protein
MGGLRRSGIIAGKEPAMDKNNTPGRMRNAAEPLGERPGLESDRMTRKVGLEERATGGPDGGSAKEVGDTFKESPGKKKP